MSSIWTWGAYRGIQTAIDTGLNSLATDTIAISSAIDNSSNRDLYADCDLLFQWASTPNFYSGIGFMLFASIDGTNYGTVPATTTGYRSSQGTLVASYDARTVTSQQRIVVTQIPLTPGLFKFGVENNGGVSFVSSGNVFRYNPYTIIRNSPTQETLRWSPYAGVQTVFSTEYNSQAAGNTDLSSAIDNSSTRYTHADFEYVGQHSGAVTEFGGVLTLAIMPCIDGTNYSSEGYLRLQYTYFNSWIYGSSAFRMIIPRVPLPPGLFKVKTGYTGYQDGFGGRALASSGNTLRYNPYSLELTT